MINPRCASEAYFGNLDTRRDWELAGNYVQASRLMLHQSSGEDFDLAIAATHSARVLCRIAFMHLGLDYRRLRERRRGRISSN